MHRRQGLHRQRRGRYPHRPESPAIQGDDALQEIASPGNYYAQPEPVALTNIFLAISADIAKGTSRING